MHITFRCHYGKKLGIFSLILACNWQCIINQSTFIILFCHLFHIYSLYYMYHNVISSLKRYISVASAHPSQMGLSQRKSQKWEGPFKQMGGRVLVCNKRKLLRHHKMYVLAKSSMKSERHVSFTREWQGKQTILHCMCESGSRDRQMLVAKTPKMTPKFH